MRPFLFFLSCLPGLALAEACIVHSQAKNLDVKVCQQNRSIPAKLFREGFCQPQLQGQKVEVAFAEECPTGAFGVCRDARVPNAPYRQDIFYYGVATDARYLEPFCASQSQGRWEEPSAAKKP
ncbi:NADH:ubiquinone oxidoreductase [Pseudomonas aeruginosa]|uniref:NADH:ubiquinone oxidoreductase n=2 Tax=Gammaproteobacteria TaxID=1236 RepID=A0A643J444_PSEAI|nr:NADH:ubiquinone oxidoreductase [Pseudomonas aeruginosa]EKV4469693.1 NADH:ubiquinone oxidoreductase [Pseudomonas aeruginosa]EKY1745461.1 NADH:ubiquinone oxidoreductase [Pseudomonas aeruginosa]ELQ7872958.1 NADH:ubiquinone oxidoreductase [Pseudomonas aeruginosa]KAB0767662.1 NADH:ubiquinone oxidoreductase [Pseudomonas aeruginosa]MBH8939543.1 NADH:ubiquinone oxidoreductase [Pseudomonas aeruginosa]